MSESWDVTIKEGSAFLKGWSVPLEEHPGFRNPWIKTSMEHAPCHHFHTEGVPGEPDGLQWHFPRPQNADGNMGVGKAGESHFFTVPSPSGRPAEALREWDV